MIQHLSNLSNKTSLKLGQLNIWKLETTTLRPYLITLLCPLVNKNSRLERKLFARKSTLWMVNFYVRWVERCNGISHQPRVSLSVCLWTRATAAETKGGNLSVKWVKQRRKVGFAEWLLPSQPAFFRGRTVELQGELVTSGTSWFPYRLKATSTPARTRPILWSSKRLGSSFVHQHCGAKSGNPENWEKKRSCWYKTRNWDNLGSHTLTWTTESPKNKYVSAICGRIIFI